MRRAPKRDSAPSARQRRWNQIPYRPDLFRDCVFFVQSDGRHRRDEEADLAIIQFRLRCWVCGHAATSPSTFPQLCPPSLSFLPQAHPPQPTIHHDPTQAALTRQEHGGRVVSNPFNPWHRPTHIIVHVPYSPANHHQTLPFGYPIAHLGDYSDPRNWSLNDLLAFALLSRAANQPVIIVQSQWLRECGFVGEIIDQGDAFDTWNVR